MTTEFFRLIIILFVVGALLLGLGIAALCLLAHKAGNASRAKRTIKPDHQIPSWTPATPETSTTESITKRAPEINRSFFGAVLMFGVLISAGIVRQNPLPLIFGGLATLICVNRFDRLKAINFALVALVEVFGILIALSIAAHSLKPLYLIAGLVVFYRAGGNRAEDVPPPTT